MHRFHVNSGVDGSSLSSPLESPDAPITSSVATLQSAESLSIRRQVRLAELSSGHYADLLVSAKRPISLTVPQPHSPATAIVTPETPSAKVTPASMPSRSGSDSDLPRACSPSALLTPSSESPEAVLSNPDDVDFMSFYDEFWEMTYFEHDLRCISIHNFTDVDIDDDDDDFLLNS